MLDRLPCSLSARITLGVVATVLVIGAASFGVLQDFYRSEMIDSLAESTTVQGELVEQSLRYAMHTRSLDLLAEMVHSLADQKGVEKVMILNKQGTIRFSSTAEERGTVLTHSDPTCKICHRRDVSVRGRTVIFEAGERQVFRNVNPILNSESCFGCHPSTDKVNGVLIVDYSLAGIEASLDASSKKMWLSAIALTVATTVVLVIFMRRTVLERLRGLVSAVDSIEAGRLDQPVDERGVDEISLLSRHLNRMARSLARSLGELREREAYLDAVINSADDAIVVVDEQLRVVKANRAFEAIREEDHAGLLDSPCVSSAMCAACEPDECPARLTFTTGQVTRRIRTVTRRSGARHFYEISSSPLRAGDDSPQVIEVWRDITRRRELEAQLAHSEQLASLGFLASGISHEINNPLASITTCLDGLRRRLRDVNGERMPAELPEYLALIRGEVGRCRELTERLRLLGRKPLEIREEVDLGAIVHETLALVRPEAARRAVDIEERQEANGWLLLADDGQLRQVILNLVLNAIQAVEGPGRVGVVVRTAPDGVILEVTDTGRGISPTHVDRIFEPFFSARRDGRGTGLGLFISKIIIDQLGGTIRVASTPGRETRFTLWFPAIPAPHGGPVP